MFLSWNEFILIQYRNGLSDESRERVSDHSSSFLQARTSKQYCVNVAPNELRTFSLSTSVSINNTTSEWVVPFNSNVSLLTSNMPRERIEKYGDRKNLCWVFYGNISFEIPRAEIVSALKMYVNMYVSVVIVWTQNKRIRRKLHLARSISHLKP